MRMVLPQITQSQNKVSESFYNRRVSQRVSQTIGADRTVCQFLESKVYRIWGKGVCFAKYNYISMFLVVKIASSFAKDYTNYFLMNKEVPKAQ